MLSYNREAVFRGQTGNDFSVKQGIKHPFQHQRECQAHRETDSAKKRQRRVFGLGKESFSIAHPISQILRLQFSIVNNKCLIGDQEV